MWSAKLGDGSIYSSPCVARAVYAAALDGTCSSLAEDDGHVLWKQKLESPVFSSPAVIEDESVVLFAEVSGVIHCLSGTEGKEVITFTSAYAVSPYI
jgi:outer membrane protein assembly factor BamB